MMMKGLSSSFPNPRAAAENDSDYFATETHCLSLVNRIDGALRHKGRLVLVTGDPPPAPQLLTQALPESTGSHYAVVDIVCNPNLTSEDLARATSTLATRPASGTSITMPQTSEPSQRLFIFANVDQLSDRQIREIFADAQYSGEKGTAALLLAPSSFLGRLGEPSLHFLKDRLAAHFGFQEVGQDEGIEFLRHRLTARHAHNESQGIPAGVFRGLTALGLLLVIGISAFLFLQYYPLLQKPLDVSAPAVVPKSEGVAARSTNITLAPRRPEDQSASAAPNVPAVGAAPQPGLIPKTAPIHVAGAPAEDHPESRVPLPAALDPTRPARVPETTSSPLALPSAAADTPEPQLPPIGAEASATRSARTVEPPPTAASPILPPQQVSPKAGSRESSLASVQSLASQPLSPTEIVALVARGDAFLGAGDIASARLFYERAADAGNGSAALRLGATFDTGFLDRAGIRGITGDAAQAASWYRRAHELGDPAAADRLKNLDQQRAGERNSSPR
jgi:hypothetical protein